MLIRLFLPITRDTKRQFAPLKLGSHLVMPSSTVKNLGFIFNRSLSISDHVKYIRQNTFYHLQRIRALRGCLSFVSREILTHAFLTSRIDFCNSLFYGATTDMIRGVHSLLTAAARSLTGACPMTSNKALLFRLHWLPVEARINYKLALLGFRILQSEAPQYFSQISKSVTSRHMRSSSAPLLTSLLYTSTSRLKTYADRSCFNSICHVFNSLPSDIRAADNLNSFKCLLKKHY
jgi:hypothetical protein